MKKFKLYQLIDPRISENDIKNRIRYIGITMKPLSYRKSEHISESKTSSSQAHTHKNRWINSLVKEGFIPEIELICSVDTVEEVKELEKFYITKYRAEGYKLTNISNGGDGNPGRVVSEETKEKFYKAVDVYNKQGEFIQTIKSVTEAGIIYQTHSGKISDVCNGKRKSSKNMVFRHHGDPFNKYEVKKNSGAKTKVAELDSENNIITIFDSVKECMEQTGISVWIMKEILKKSSIENNTFKLWNDRKFIRLKKI